MQRKKEEGQAAGKEGGETGEAQSEEGGEGERGGRDLRSLRMIHRRIVLAVVAACPSVISVHLVEVWQTKRVVSAVPFPVIGCHLRGTGARPHPQTTCPGHMNDQGRLGSLAAPQHARGP